MCAYKPPVVSNQSTNGLANVRKSTDGSKFKVTLKVQDGDEVETKTFILSLPKIALLTSKPVIGG